MRYKQEWRFIDTGPGSGSDNMATDEALLESCIDGYSPSILHFYTWRHPVITIGYLQDLKKTICVDECKTRNIEVIRRITGGKAVVHHKDLSFSLIFPARGEIIPPGIFSGYLKVAGGFMKGLNGLGLNVHFPDSTSRQGGASLLKERAVSACLLSRMRYEILSNGRKIIGFAQRRLGDWILQQGTLMIDLERRLWYDLLKYQEGKNCIDIRERFLSDTTSLYEDLNQRISIGLIKKGILCGLSDSLSVKFKSCSILSREEKKKIHLMKEKYYNLLENR